MVISNYGTAGLTARTAFRTAEISSRGSPIIRTTIVVLGFPLRVYRGWYTILGVVGDRLSNGPGTSTLSPLQKRRALDSQINAPEASSFVKTRPPRSGMPNV